MCFHFDRVEEDDHGLKLIANLSLEINDPNEPFGATARLKANVTPSDYIFGNYSVIDTSTINITSVVSKPRAGKHSCKSKYTNMCVLIKEVVLNIIVIKVGLRR